MDDIKYRLALKWVQAVSEHLERGTMHIRDCDDALLLTLDEVVQAAIDDRLLPDDEPVQVEPLALAA